MTDHTSHSVLILGAGLTGTAIGHFLSTQGHRVTLLDHPGWQDGYGTDANAPLPIVFGGYRETWRLLHAIDNSTSAQANRTIPLEFRLPDGQVAVYQSARLPGALQWVTGLFSFRGLTRHDRWKLLSYMEQIWEQALTLPADLDNRLAHDWLASIGQSPESCNRIWSPLSRWLTGNSLERLSATVFVRHLSTLFLGQATDARLTYLHGTIGDRMIDPMKQLLERHNCRFLSQTEEPLIRFGRNGITGIRLHNGSILDAQWYIAALPHRKLLTLIPEHLLTRYAYFAQMIELETIPAITVSFTQSSPPPSPRLLLCSDQPFHQLTVTPSGPGEVRYWLSAVSNPALADLRDEQLIDLGRTKLHLLSPDTARNAFLSGDITRHDQAALSLKPGMALRRPIQQSPVPNFLIAGAWTDTGWPPAIESALISARRCAEIVSGRNDH